jgi:hypothetical protein
LDEALGDVAYEEQENDLRQFPSTPATAMLSIRNSTIAR